MKYVNVAAGVSPLEIGVGQLESSGSPAPWHLPHEMEKRAAEGCRACYRTVEVEEIPEKFRSMALFFRPSYEAEGTGTAYLVREGQEHLIVIDERARMGIIASDGSAAFGNFRKWLIRNGFDDAIAISSKPLAYVFNFPDGIFRCSDGRILQSFGLGSAVYGYSVDSFFPLHGKPGEEARPQLEKARADPLRSLEKLMSEDGYAVRRLF